MHDRKKQKDDGLLASDENSSVRPRVISALQSNDEGSDHMNPEARR